MLVREGGLMILENWGSEEGKSEDVAKTALARFL